MITLTPSEVVSYEDLMILFGLESGLDDQRLWEYSRDAGDGSVLFFSMIKLARDYRTEMTLKNGRALLNFRHIELRPRDSQ